MIVSPKPCNQLSTLSFRLAKLANQLSETGLTKCQVAEKIWTKLRRSQGMKAHPNGIADCDGQLQDIMTLAKRLNSSAQDYSAALERLTRNLKSSFAVSLDDEPVKVQRQAQGTKSTERKLQTIHKQSSKSTNSLQMTYSKAGNNQQQAGYNKSCMDREMYKRFYRRLEQLQGAMRQYQSASSEQQDTELPQVRLKIESSSVNKPQNTNQEIVKHSGSGKNQNPSQKEYHLGNRGKDPISEKDDNHKIKILSPTRRPSLMSYGLRKQAIDSQMQPQPDSSSIMSGLEGYDEGSSMLEMLSIPSSEPKSDEDDQDDDDDDDDQDDEDDNDGNSCDDDDNADDDNDDQDNNINLFPNFANKNRQMEMRINATNQDVNQMRLSNKSKFNTIRTEMSQAKISKEQKIKRLMESRLKERRKIILKNSEKIKKIIRDTNEGRKRDIERERDQFIANRPKFGDSIDRLVTERMDSRANRLQLSRNSYNRFEASNALSRLPARRQEQTTSTQRERMKSEVIAKHQQFLRRMKNYISNEDAKEPESSNRQPNKRRDPHQHDSDEDHNQNK